MNNNTLKKLRNKLLLIGFILIVIIFIFLLAISTIDSKKIKNIKQFVTTDTKVLYISTQKNYSEYAIKLLNKYEINYLYVNSNNLNKFEKKKVERIINSKYLSNIIIIYRDGKLVDAIIDFNSNKSLNIFLQKNNIIPNIIGKVDGIFDSVKEELKGDLTLLYLPYKHTDYIDSQNQMLKKLCNKYNIKYKMLNTYLLSSTQRDKLNLILEISKVEDQIAILIKDSKIIGNIRGKNSYGEFIKKMNEYKFIDKGEDYINYIDLTKFSELISSDEKSIIVIGKDECKYCEDVKLKLNQIIYEYNTNINYINIHTIESDNYKKILDALDKLKYNDGFSTPLTIIVEADKLVDYVIGPSSYEYFIDIFKENGIIKEEVE